MAKSKDRVEVVCHTIGNALLFVFLIWLCVLPFWIEYVIRVS